jgi:hypothetical protein
MNAVINMSLLTLTCYSGCAALVDSKCYMIWFSDHFGSSFGNQLKRDFSRLGESVR